MDLLIVKGAREHNLRNVDVEIPKMRFNVFTGVSGSGKSSLAFDTIFAEGQRRYVESLSAYARQFLGQMEKPKYETIKGLSPTISIEQKSASKNPRSTVGTITEIYDYLRVLYARVGTQFCYRCNSKVGRGDAAAMVEQILQLARGTSIYLLAPKVENRKGEHREVLDELRSAGYVRLRVDGAIVAIEEIQALAKNKKHTIEVVVDRLKLGSGASFKNRLTDSVETTLKLGKGRLILHVAECRDMHMSEERSCCDIAYPELSPQLFSFNAPQGMCSECHGLGTILGMDEDKVVPDRALTIREGAVVPWRNFFNHGEEREGSWSVQQFRAMEKKWGINFDQPWKKLPKKQQQIILYGSAGEEMVIKWQAEKIQGTYSTEWEGVLNSMMRRYLKTQSEAMKSWYGKFMSSKKCSACAGERLKPEVLTVDVGGLSIVKFSSLSIRDANNFIENIKLSKHQAMIAGDLLKEIGARLRFLINVGLDYLTLNRKGPSLSGGEAQRIRLASQIGSELTGVLYILDEPSIGLHQRDNRRLLDTLLHLRDMGNTLIVVEHDQETIEAADWVLDLGPGAGTKGGEIVARGTPDEIRQTKGSLTGEYLSGKRFIAIPKDRRAFPKARRRQLLIRGASANNLRNIDFRLPLGLFTVITGVSGAGKSTLINQILYPALFNRLHGGTLETGEFKEIRGLEHLNKVINIDQKAIGRTPRSNPATYTKVFDQIRDFYAMLPEAKTRGYSKGRFSFNVKGGRCETCQGDGFITVEMHFLADVFVFCEVCQGRRFNASTLEVTYKGKSIADVLDATVLEAREIFDHHPKITKVFDTLIEVGLSYIKLGQSATTLSGGEAQRIKLARELSRIDTGDTLYILDEPTTGLHFEDVKNLLTVLHKLVERGNTVLVIEHNLDVIKTADWVVDLGPEGGDDGGAVIAVGTPEDVVEVEASYTGRFLRRMFNL